MSTAFVLLSLVCTFYFVTGIVAKKKALHLPTAVSFLYIAFFIPQAIFLDRSGLSEAYNGNLLFLYMTACLIATAIGFKFARVSAVNRAISTPISIVPESRLIAGSVLLAGLGAFANWRLGGVDTNALGSQWTGVATLWYLLAQSLFFALAISTLRFMATRNLIYLGVAVFTLFSVLSGFSINVKRHMIAEVFIVLGGAWFFVKGQQPPRVGILAICFLGVVLLHQVGAVRAYVASGQGNAFEAFMAGVPFERFEYFSADRAPELSVALINMDDAQKQGIIEGPVVLWNQLVHQYVPAFIVGRDAKESLKLSTHAVREVVEYDQYATIGITHTGFSDTFRSYSYFGVLVFLGIGAFFGWLYGFAVHGRIWAQIYYVVLLNDALISFTESASRFLATLPFVFALTLPIFLPALTSAISRRSRLGWAPPVTAPGDRGGTRPGQTLGVRRRSVRRP